MPAANSLRFRMPFLIKCWTGRTRKQSRYAACMLGVICTAELYGSSPTGYSGSPASCSQTEPPTSRSTRPLVMQKQFDHWWGVPPLKGEQHSQPPNGSASPSGTGTPNALIVMQISP